MQAHQRKDPNGWTKTNAFLYQIKNLIDLDLGAIICTLTIDALEGRCILAIVDVIDTFPKEEMTDFVLVKFQGLAAEVILTANKKRYNTFVSIEYGRQVLYVKLRKATYGSLMAALLWYKLFAGTIRYLAFQINHYDLFVSNCPEIVHKS